MPFLDLISISSLLVEDISEAAAVLIGSHIRDPILDLQFPRAQRNVRTTWSNRTSISASTLSWCLEAGQIMMVAKYVPDNRIVGIISVHRASLDTMVFEKPGSQALLDHNNFFGAFERSEISPYLTGRYEVEHERALRKCNMSGDFWHDAGLCTLSEFEGKGIGYKLIETLYGRLARLKNGPKTVFASTNSRSRHVFEDYGFKLSYTIRIDLDPITQSRTQINAVNKPGSSVKPKYFNEYCLTYDLSDAFNRPLSNQLPRPSPPLRFATDGDRNHLTLKQYSRLVRPVSSLADIRTEGRTRVRKRGQEMVRMHQN